MPEQQDILELTETTAKNLYELMMRLASRIKELEAENAELKSKLPTKSKRK